MKPCRYAVVAYIKGDTPGQDGVGLFKMIGCSKSKSGARKIAREPWAQASNPGIVPMSAEAAAEIGVGGVGGSRALVGAAAKAASSPQHCRTSLSKCMKSNATVTAGGKKAAAALCMRDFNRCRR